MHIRCISCYASWGLSHKEDWVPGRCGYGANNLQVFFKCLIQKLILHPSGGVALSALTVSKELGLFLFTYSLMYGIGMGLPYSVLSSLASDVSDVFSL